MAADLFPQSFVFEMSEPMLDDEELERILTQHLHEKTSFNETDKALEEDSHVPSTTESSALIPYDGISTDPSCCPVTRTESLPDEVPAFNPSQGFENLVRRPSTAVPVMSTEPLFTELTLAGSTDDILLPITPTLFSYEYNPGSPLLGNIDRNLYSPPPPPPPPPFHDQFSRRRSRSEPPGEITFHRNGSYIGQKAASRQAFPLPAREPRGYRRQPYTASPRTPISKRPTKWNRKVETWMGPTSRPRSAAPSPCTVLGELASPFSTPLMSHREVNEVTPMENVMEAPPQQLMQERLASHKEASAVLGMYLERVTRDLDAVKHYLNKGFGFTEGPMGEVERLRSEARAANGTITHIQETLQILPRAPENVVSDDNLRFGLPKNGAEIRTLDHHVINSLLQLYDIPFSYDMLLPTKKELYLRFIGANDALVHSILD